MAGLRIVPGKGQADSRLPGLLQICTDIPDNPASGRVMAKCGFVDTNEETVCPNLEVGSDRPVRIMRLDSVPIP